MNPAAAAAVTVALLAGNGFFVAAEFAVVAARRSAVELAAEHGSRRAAATLAAMRRLSLMLAGAQLGVTVCSLALGAVSEPALAHLLEPAFDAAGLPAGATHPAAFVLALTVITGLHVVLGEMVPKNATLAAPDSAALWLAPPLAAVVQALRPLIAALDGATNLMLRVARVRPREEGGSTITPEQLPGVLRASRREGLLADGEHDLLSNAVSFENATAGDLALPLGRVHTVPPDASAESVEALAAATGVSRFPVRDGDRLLGYLHVRDILDTPAADRAAPLPPATRRTLPTVPDDLSLSDAVDRMRTGRAHMAAVTAASSTAAAPRRVVGIVTLDDILDSLTS